MGKQHACAVSFLISVGDHSKMPFQIWSPSKAASMWMLQESETVTKMPSFKLMRVSVIRSSGEALDFLYDIVSQENEALSTLLVSS